MRWLGRSVFGALMVLNDVKEPLLAWRKYEVGNTARLLGNVNLQKRGYGWTLYGRRQDLRNGGMYFDEGRLDKLASFVSMAKKGNVDEMKDLLKEFSQRWFMAEEIVAALTAAVGGGHGEMVELLQSHFQRRIGCESMAKLLHLAVDRGDCHMVRRIYGQFELLGSDMQNDMDEALFLAVKNGDESMVMELVRLVGSQKEFSLRAVRDCWDLVTLSNDYSTARVLAKFFTHDVFLRMAVSSSMQMAAKHNRVFVVRLLVDVLSVDYFDHIVLATCLHTALMEDSRDVALMLMGLFGRGAFQMLVRWDTLKTLCALGRLWGVRRFVELVGSDRFGAVQINNAVRASVCHSDVLLELFVIFDSEVLDTDNMGKCLLTAVMANADASIFVLLANARAEQFSTRHVHNACQWAMIFGRHDLVALLMHKFGKLKCMGLNKLE